MRVPFSTATIIPVVLGSVLAWHDTAGFFWDRFWLALIGAILIHIGTNLANDYFDHLAGCDKVNTNPTPFSGGSRVIQQGLIPPKNILYVSPNNSARQGLAELCIFLILFIFKNKYNVFAL